MIALAKDVKIVKTLPKNLKEARRQKEIPVFRVPHSASPYFYLHNVLPVLNKHSVIELVVSDGGCLQVMNLNINFCFPPVFVARYYHMMNGFCLLHEETN